jgi:O-methyltransferase
MKISEFIDLVKSYTITSEERIICLYESLEYIRLNNIEGDLVECGVFKGGNILGMMEYCNFYNLSKNIWGFDTFSGMTEPEDVDIDHNDTLAKNIYQSNDIICKSSLDEVNNVLQKSNFDKRKLNLVIGDVCETLKIDSNIPNKISLLRLDTDWYKSTKTELEVLYPKLSNDGLLIIDDYGHWKGAKLAVDEYFDSQKFEYEFIDYTGIKHKK